MSEASAPPVARVFGDRVRQSRKASAWTQGQLADATGEAGQRIDRAGISRIEANTRAVQLGEALIIAAALGVAPDHLIAPLGSDERMRLGTSDGAPTYTAGQVTAWLRGDAPLPGMPERYLWGMGPVGRNPVATALRGAVKHAEAAQDPRQAAKVAEAAIAVLQGLLPMLALDDVEG